MPPDSRTHPRSWTWRSPAAAGVLGFTTTIGIAWGLAFSDFTAPPIETGWSFTSNAPYATTFISDRTDFAEVDVYRTPGGCFISSFAAGPDFRRWPGDADVREVVRVDPPCPLTDVTPGWAHDAVFPWLRDPGQRPQGSDSLRTSACARGWPMVAVYWSEQTGSDLVTHIHGAVPARLNRRFWVGSPFGWRRDAWLPCLPVWPGLLVDAVLYSGAWFVAIRSAAAVRRRARERAGRCGSCGYDLRGIRGVCPECGGPASHASAGAELPGVREPGS